MTDSYVRGVGSSREWEPYRAILLLVKAQASRRHPHRREPTQRLTDWTPLTKTYPGSRSK